MKNKKNTNNTQDTITAAEIIDQYLNDRELDISEEQEDLLVAECQSILTDVYDVNFDEVSLKDININNIRANLDKVVL